VIDLLPVKDVSTGIDILYQLLKERTPEQSISHKGMPTLQEHTDFVESDPYLAWLFIYDKDEGEMIGSIYLTELREVGISIFKHHQGLGYGKGAVRILMQRYPGKFLANINPENEASIGFFNGMGFKHIQNTYEYNQEI